MSLYLGKAEQKQTHHKPIDGEVDTECSSDFIENGDLLQRIDYCDLAGLCYLHQELFTLGWPIKSMAPVNTRMNNSIKKTCR